MGRTEIILFFVAAIVALMALVVGVAVFIFLFRKKMIEHNKEKEQSEQEHRQELLASQIEIQQQTMQHIGREIHDNVGQKLTLASLYTQQLGYQNQYPTINTSLMSISGLIDESLKELRNLSKNLTDSYFQLTDMETLLRQECEKINQIGGCQVETTFNGSIVRASLLVKTIVLRILQEFMQNSLKHAACSIITVQLNNDGKGLYLLMIDNGKGFDVATVDNGGIGLANMKKRAEMIGADWQLQSEINKGTSLQFFIPSHNLNL